MENITSKIGSGSTPRGSNYSNEGIPFFRSQNVHNEGIVYEDIKYITPEIHSSMAGTEVLPMDLLLNITGGSIGRCAVIPNEFITGNVSQHVCIIRPILIDSEYLHSYILSNLFWSSMKLTGSGREGLPKYNLEQMILPLPPIEEQKRIVKSIKNFNCMVSEIEVNQFSMNEIINGTKSKILELAMQGRIVPQDPADEPAADMLRRINPKARIITDNPHSRKLPKGWCLCTVKDLCSFLSRGKSPKYSGSPNQYPVYAQKCNLKDGGISLAQARFLDETTLDKWPEKFRLKSGDVLINSTGTGTVGRTRLFNDNVLGDYPFTVPDSHVSVVRSFDEIDSSFLFFQLFSPSIQEYFEDNLAGSTNQKELYIDVIGNAEIMLPPTNEQIRIVAKIDELYAILDEIEASLQS